jgi:hypothetical protein
MKKQKWYVAYNYSNLWAVGCTVYACVFGSVTGMTAITYLAVSLLKAVFNPVPEIIGDVVLPAFVFVLMGIYVAQTMRLMDSRPEYLSIPTLTWWQLFKTTVYYFTYAVVSPAIAVFKKVFGYAQ